MLFLVFGSSGSGKTFTLNILRDRFDDLAVHDFDEIGVPTGADTAWRRRANEQWLSRALEYQAAGIDLLLAGNTPLGELLATPSAPQLDAISACLFDCDDDTRIARLEARGPEWLARASGTFDGYLGWAAWMREHAADPTRRTFVIRNGSESDMHWSRWSNWQAGDPRWRVTVIDTSSTPVEAVAAELMDWITEERALLRSGEHPLTGALNT